MLRRCCTRCANYSSSCNWSVPGSHTWLGKGPAVPIYSSNACSQLAKYSTSSAISGVAAQDRNADDSESLLDQMDSVNFGLAFDIDGVLVRGKDPLPFASQAFQKLIDKSTGKFRVPTIFVTNAGNRLRCSKAEQLSDWLNCEVSEDQVVMSHSPLRMYDEFHDKTVLVAGQGQILDIARNLGFHKRIVTIEELREAFPNYDSVDMNRRNEASRPERIPPIEAIILFGESIRWETSLQLIFDTLIMNGKLDQIPHLDGSSANGAGPNALGGDHLPILACNMDLQWMGEAPMPRLGHGAFLHSLENLYMKIMGKELVYTALMGKPSEITYIYGEHLLQKQAESLGGCCSVIEDIYCIGDNVCTDVLGANLYHRFLQTDRSVDGQTGKGVAIPDRVIGHLTRCNMLPGLKSHATSHDDSSKTGSARNCYSVLVRTGVFSNGSAFSQENGGDGDASKSDDCKDADCDPTVAAMKHMTVGHSPRDFLPVDQSHVTPTHNARDVLEAVDLILKEQLQKSRTVDV